MPLSACSIDEHIGKRQLPPSCYNQSWPLASMQGKPLSNVAHLAKLEKGRGSLGLLLLAVDALDGYVNVVEQLAVELDAVAAAEEHHHLHCRRMQFDMNAQRHGSPRVAGCCCDVCSARALTAPTFLLAFFFKKVNSSRKRLSAGTTQ
jgi:hypothetical protein